MARRRRVSRREDVNALLGTSLLRDMDTGAVWSGLASTHGRRGDRYEVTYAEDPPNARRGRRY